MKPESEKNKSDLLNIGFLFPMSVFGRRAVQNTRKFVRNMSCNVGA
jgi:hypothetical protein